MPHSPSLIRFFAKIWFHPPCCRRVYTVLYVRLGDVFKQSTMVFTEQTGLDKLYR